MLTPCPASGWTLWAASLQMKQSLGVASSSRVRREQLCSASTLPDERQPRPDVLSSMSQPKRKQYSAFGVHLGYAWRQLAS